MRRKMTEVGVTVGFTQYVFVTVKFDREEPDQLHPMVIRHVYICENGL